MADEKSSNSTDLMPLPPLSEGLLWHPVRFEQAQRVAKLFIASGLVPEHLLKTMHGEHGAIGNVLIGLDLAARMNESPIFILQNIYFVAGKPNWMTSYMISRANASKIFAEPLNWETEITDTANLKVTCFAYIRHPANGESLRREAWADMVMAQKEGWTKNVKYQSMPEHMLKFRSAAMFIRTHCPQVLMGLDMLEEDDVDVTERDRSPWLQDDGVVVITPAAPQPQDFAETSSPPTSPSPPPSSPAPTPSPTPAPPPTATSAPTPEPTATSSPPSSPAPPPTSPPPSSPTEGADFYELIGHDGVATLYEDPSEAFTELSVLLEEAAKISQGTLDGVWESNADAREALCRLEPSEVALSSPDTISAAFNRLYNELSAPPPPPLPPPTPTPTPTPPPASSPSPTSSATSSSPPPPRRRGRPPRNLRPQSQEVPAHVTDVPDEFDSSAPSPPPSPPPSAMPASPSLSPPPSTPSPASPSTPTPSPAPAASSRQSAGRDDDDDTYFAKGNLSTPTYYTRCLAYLRARRAERWPARKYQLFRKNNAADLITIQNDMGMRWWPAIDDFIKAGESGK